MAKKKPAPPPTDTITLEVTARVPAGSKPAAVAQYVQRLLRAADKDKSLGRPEVVSVPLTYAAVRWSPEDVIAVAAEHDKPMTVAEAEAFLDENEKHLRDGLVEDGHGRIEALLDFDDDEEDEEDDDDDEDEDED